MLGFRPCARAACGALSMMRSAAHPSRSAHVDVSSLRGKHLDSLFSLSGAEMNALLDLSSALKASLRRGGAGAGRGGYAPLRGRSLAMLFQKRSTRTRVSTEAGFAMLGGHPLFLGAASLQRRCIRCAAAAAALLRGCSSLTPADHAAASPTPTPQAPRTSSSAKTRAYATLRACCRGSTTASSRACTGTRTLRACAPRRACP
jgi:ornithine carbamoyltransferase